MKSMVKIFTIHAENVVSSGTVCMPGRHRHISGRIYDSDHKI
jgi:hypothetical protein